MKSRVTLSLLLAGCFFTLSAQEGTEGIKFMANEPWQQVLQQAKSQGRLIFMDCYTDWCGPCKGLAREIFPLKDVGDFFNANFVNTKYDMEKGEGKILYEKYRENIVGFPTLLLIDADGKVVHQMAGYHKADALIAGMKAGLEGKSLFSTRARYETGARDLETVVAYVDALNGAFQKDKIPGVVQEFLATIPVERLLEPEVWTLVGPYIKDPYSEQYRFVLQNIERGYQYRLKVDRYALETQLARGMSAAVSEILKITSSTRDADTLRQERERAGYLKEILVKSPIKYFPTYLAKLQFNDLVLAGDPRESYRFFTRARELGLLSSDVLFSVESYRRIIELTKDKKLIRACLEGVQKLQEKQEATRIDLAFNFYNVIALGHEKLKEREAARAATEEYERRQAIKNEYFTKLFGGDSSAGEAKEKTE
jgi:thiol-disulfide isomerase/thioredoxin